MQPLGELLVGHVATQAVIVVILIVGAEVHCLKLCFQASELVLGDVVAQNSLELGLPCLLVEIGRLHHDGWSEQ